MINATLFFDVGNVMIFFSYEKMIEKLASYLDTTKEQVHQYIVDQKLQESYELGLLSTEEFHLSFCSHFEKNLSLKDFEHCLNHTFSPNEKIIPLLNALKEKKHKLIVLSNTCASHFDYLLNQYDFLKIFDEYILSHKVSLRKPDPKIYQLALSKSGEKTFFIDDLQENVDAAQKAGLDARLFTDVSSLQKDLSEKGLI